MSDAWLWLILYFFVLCWLTWYGTRPSRSARQDLISTTQAHAKLADPLYQSAMAELDEIDHSYGLLPGPIAPVYRVAPLVVKWGSRVWALPDYVGKTVEELTIGIASKTEERIQCYVAHLLDDSGVTRPLPLQYVLQRGDTIEYFSHMIGSPWKPSR